MIIFRHEDYSKYIKVRNRKNLLSDLANEERIPVEEKIKYIINRTLRTTWVVREIDKITAMGYFAVIISIFISAVFVFPDFLDNKVLGIFQEGNQTGADIPTTVEVVGSGTAGGEGTAGSMVTGGEATATVSPTNVTNIPTTAEGRNQSTLVAKMHINEACLALQNNDTQGVMMHLDLALNELDGGNSR